eukprot:11539606-Alexandrium_andersonii.AAC.1
MGDTARMVVAMAALMMAMYDDGGGEDCLNGDVHGHGSWSRGIAMVAVVVVATATEALSNTTGDG